MRAPVLVAALASLASLASAGCLRSTQFTCATSSDCGAAGTCEDTHFCSFADASCAGGRRYGELSGSYANACVGGMTGGDGGGVDSPGDGPKFPCKASYAALPGVTTHVYRLLPTAAWSTQQSTCAMDGPNAYLAIPNDATELAALIGGAAVARQWVGIDDMTTEGSYVTVLNQPATFLPWNTAAGEPDNAGPQGGEDCAAADQPSGKLYDDKCSISYAAYCECEP